MIAFSVVVLPAPFRPSSVTSSPGCTSKSTPCKMCDSPYHAWRSRTARSGSGMRGPHVRLADHRAAGHRRVIAFREDLAARQDRDRVRQVFDDAEIVLDHEDRAVLGNTLDQHRDALDVF